MPRITQLARRGGAWTLRAPPLHAEPASHLLTLGSLRPVRAQAWRLAPQSRAAWQPHYHPCPSTSTFSQSCLGSESKFIEAGTSLPVWDNGPLRDYMTCPRPQGYHKETGLVSTRLPLPRCHPSIDLALISSQTNLKPKGKRGRPMDSTGPLA